MQNVTNNQIIELSRESIYEEKSVRKLIQLLEEEEVPNVIENARRLILACTNAQMSLALLTEDLKRFFKYESV